MNHQEFLEFEKEFNFKVLKDLASDSSKEF
jgi:hypothetical protein